MTTRKTRTAGRAPTWQEIDALVRAAASPLPASTTHTAWGIARRYLREVEDRIEITFAGRNHIMGH